MSLIAYLHDKETLLRAVNAFAPQAELRFLIEGVTRKCYTDFLTGQAVLGAHEKEVVNRVVKQRLQGMPMAYLLREAPFQDFDLRVTKGVFIPRPETEILVEAAIGFCQNRGGRTRLLDLGCGAGNIPVGILRKVPRAQMTAVDFSNEAIECTRSNLSDFDLSHRCECLHVDYQKDWEALKGPFDAIVANPPYVGYWEAPGLSREVRQEPFRALFGGIRGDEVLEWILLRASEKLASQGSVLLEVGKGQARGLQNYAEARTPLRVTRVIKDARGIDRVLVLHLTN